MCRHKPSRYLPLKYSRLQEIIWFIAVFFLLGFRASKRNHPDPVQDVWKSELEFKEHPPPASVIQPSCWVSTDGNVLYTEPKKPAALLVLMVVCEVTVCRTTRLSVFSLLRGFYLSANIFKSLLMEWTSITVVPGNTSFSRKRLNQQHYFDGWNEFKCGHKYFYLFNVQKDEMGWCFFKPIRCRGMIVVIIMMLWINYYSDCQQTTVKTRMLIKNKTKRQKKLNPGWFFSLWENISI